MLDIPTSQLEEKADQLEPRVREDEEEYKIKKYWIYYKYNQIKGQKRG